VKRFIIIFLSYAGIFALGYFGLGVILHYVKPEFKMLPTSVEKILDGENPWTSEKTSELKSESFKSQLLGTTNTKQDSIIFTDHYSEEAGILCFRGNAQRNAPTRGEIDFSPTKVVVDWIFETKTDYRNTGMGAWGGGSGWTGQALLVSWPEKIRQKMTFEPDFAAKKTGKEIIIGSLCGEIYFIDFETGKASRQALSINNPIKGTVSLDPRLNGLLYVGQGIKNETRFGSYVFDLVSGKEIFYRSGLEADASRNWGAFDSNSLIDPKSGYWFHPGENGLIYKTKIDKNKTIHEPVKFKYQSTKNPQQGMEASMAAWKNLGFFGDNGGNVFCVNLQTMKPVWHFDNFDDTDASMVIDVENEQPFLYIANEVDKQGATGFAYVRKLNARTGKEIWSQKRQCGNGLVDGRINSGGVLSTTLIGQKNCSELVYSVFSRTNNSLKGELVAFNKKTGIEAFTLPLDHFSWSSPIIVYNKKGQGFLFFTDVYGGVYLANAKTGKLIFKDKLNALWESSPIADGNRIVIGSRGNKIYSFLLK
jgi:outer membrane protein assembly factor BamB